MATLTAGCVTRARKREDRTSRPSAPAGGRRLPIIAGDGHSTDLPPIPVELCPSPELRGLRIAVAPQLPGTIVARELQQNIGWFADAAAGAGVVVTDDLPEFDWSAMYKQFGARVATITGVFKPYAGLSDDQQSLAHYLTAQGNRDRMHALWAEFFHQVDVLVCPASAGTAFEH